MTLFQRPTRFLALAVLISALAGCATSSGDGGPGATTVVPFSSAAGPAGLMPKTWSIQRLSRFKKDTVYRLVPDATGVTVVEARADHSASGLSKSLNVDPNLMPWIQWRWRVPELIPSADNTRRDLEDAPVRVIVTFEGDMTKLDFEERAVAARVKALTGKSLPYATLMYIWENKAPVNEIIESAHTSRVKMIVVESGEGGRDLWRHYERNVARDFERAFGEKPGRIKSLGIMTDTDNTGEQVVAYYGDIHFSAAPINSAGANAAAAAAPTPTKESK